MKILEPALGQRQTTSVLKQGHEIAYLQSGSFFFREWLFE